MSAAGVLCVIGGVLGSTGQVEKDRRLQWRRHELDMKRHRLLENQLRSTRVLRFESCGQS